MQGEEFGSFFLYNSNSFSFLTINGNYETMFFTADNDSDSFYFLRK
jgi:hypothetical protein